MGYQKTAIKGITWMSTLRLFLRLSSLLRTIILARLLTPNDFGVFGIATIVLGFLEMGTETGINVVLIQESDSDTLTRYNNTAYTTSIIRGMLISLTIILITPVITAFYQTPEVTPFLYLISLVPFIRGFINPAIVKFQKNLEFSKEVFFKSGLVVVDATIAISAAFIFRSASSLIYGLIASAIFEVIISHGFIKPRPIPYFNLSQFKHIIGHGKWITAAGLFSFFAAKTPDIIIGKILGTSALGIYQMAYRLCTTPIDELLEVFNKVAFPIYVRIATDRPRLVRALKRNLLSVVTLGLTWSLIVVLMGPTLIPLLLGHAWSATLSLIIPFAIVNLLVIATAPLNPLYLATRHQKYLSHTSLLQLCIILVLILPLTQRYGLIGAITTSLIALACIQLPRLLFARHSLPKAL